MYIIIKVAQAELRNLFYSPIAWLLTIVFYVLCAFQFVMPIEMLTRMQDVTLEANPKWEGFSQGLSWVIFKGSYGQMVSHLYLFLPLLTMGIINREIQSGSIKLLYSSPIRTRDIVFGKYLALVIFNAILIGCIAIFLFTGYFSILNAEYKWFLTALLAIFLLANAYAAIGLFISALSTYQIVAGIVTFIVFFALYAIRGLWQQFDFVRDLTWFLSLSGRTSTMLQGLITTRDLCYFLLIIALFLAFALIKLKSTQESKPWRVSAGRYLACIFIVLALGYLTSRPGYVGYLDITKRQENTLHPNTRQVLKELDGSPLTVTLYTNLLDQAMAHGLPQNRNNYVWGFWEKVIRFYPNINLKYEYYYDVKDGDSTLFKRLRAKTLEEVADKTAEFAGVSRSLFQPPSYMRKRIDLKDENYELVMQLEYKGKKAFLRTYNDEIVWPNEDHISGTVRQLTRNSIPEVVFTTGHHERDPFKLGEREYANHTTRKSRRTALINKGVNIDTVNLQQQDIPAKTDILVVADPRSALDSMEQKKIFQWLEAGGDAIFHAEPGKQKMLQAIYQSLGVTIEPGTIVNINKHEMPHMFAAHITDTAASLGDEFNFWLYRQLKKDTPRIGHTGAANLSYETINGFRIEPLTFAPDQPNRWIENGILVVDSAAPIYAPQEGDIKKDKYTTALQLRREINGQEQRIILTSDADFMSNSRTTGLSNAFYSWLMNNEYPVYYNSPLPVDNYMTIGKKTAKILTPVFMYIIPSILFLTGLILLVRRKRK